MKKDKENKVHPETRICSDCGKEKDLNTNNFIYYPKKDYYEPKCKICRAIVTKKYYEKNKENILEQTNKYKKENKEKINNTNAIYRQNNKDKIKLSDKNYRQNNKEKVRERKKVYRKNKLKNDPIYKLLRQISNAIWYGLNGQGSSKNGKSCWKYLPYTIEELKIYLESQFEDWMSWDNWTVYNSETWDNNDKSTWVWNLDHIIPHSEFKYTSMEDESFQQCWALSNLRPYSAKQNILDGATRIRHKSKTPRKLKKGETNGM